MSKLDALESLRDQSRAMYDEAVGCGRDDLAEGFSEDVRRYAAEINALEGLTEEDVRKLDSSEYADIWR